MKKFFRFAVVALFAATLSFAYGCSKDDDDDTATSTTPTVQDDDSDTTAANGAFTRMDVYAGDDQTFVRVVTDLNSVVMPVEFGICHATEAEPSIEGSHTVVIDFESLDFSEAKDALSFRNVMFDNCFNIEDVAVNGMKDGGIDLSLQVVSGMLTPGTYHVRCYMKYADGSVVYSTEKSVTLEAGM